MQGCLEAQFALLFICLSVLCLITGLDEVGEVTGAVGVADSIGGDNSFRISVTLM